MLGGRVEARERARRSSSAFAAHGRQGRDPSPGRCAVARVEALVVAERAARCCHDPGYTAEAEDAREVVVRSVQEVLMKTLSAPSCATSEPVGPASHSSRADVEREPSPYSLSRPATSSSTTSAATPSRARGTALRRPWLETLCRVLAAREPARGCARGPFRGEPAALRCSRNRTRPEYAQCPRQGSETGPVAAVADGTPVPKAGGAGDQSGKSFDHPIDCWVPVVGVEVVD